MANTAEVINFPVPVVALQELRVADLDDGFTRIANELLEAVMHAGLSQHQLLVFMAVMRKTYGFNKKSDWVSNEQISVLTGILPALLQIVGGDKLIIPFADGAAHEPIQRPAFSA